MKKLLCLLLVLLLVPLVSFADDQDPIVGIWYMCSDFVDEPDIYLEFYIFIFTSEGSIISSMYDLSDDGTTTMKDYHVLGAWTKDDDKYYINWCFKGAEELVFDKETMFFPITDEYKLRAHKMERINYVKDFVFR